MCDKYDNVAIYDFALSLQPLFPLSTSTQGYVIRCVWMNTHIDRILVIPHTRGQSPAYMVHIFNSIRGGSISAELSLLYFLSCSNCCYEMPKKVVNIVDESSPTIKRTRTAMPPDTGMSDMAGVPRLVLRDITKLLLSFENPSVLLFCPSTTRYE